MRIHFVGADLEENLALGILAAIAEREGHQTRIVPFNDVSRVDETVQRAILRDPEVIGLSIQFQHRAPEFLLLARKLRDAGYEGHITCGGQFPTLAWRETLEGDHGVDSIVLHDGEETLVELLTAIGEERDLSTVAGLALLDANGGAHRTTARRLLDDLDGVPFPKRYRQHNEHMDVPFIPILGGRGCWGKCNYCSIITFYDDAIKAGGGRAVRLRSPANIADEMALLLDRAGGRGVFCFHDDNLLFPKEKLSLERIRSISQALDEYGVGKIGIVGKARPDCVTPELANALAELGVIRLYVGVENGSEQGGAHLRRGTQQAHVRRALAACQEAGIFVCYNLLVFEPKASLEDIRSNVRFIREHADHPINFCRAEPYHATALHLEMAEEQQLGGSYLGYTYRIDDDRTELAYRICAAAFQERNFAPQGVANRYMGLGYAANVLKRFYDVDGNSRTFQRRARLLTSKISLDTAEYLEKAIALSERVALDDWDTIERETALLGLEIAAADQHWHRELDELFDDMREFASSPPASFEESRQPSPSFLKLKASLAVGFSMVAAMPGCDDDGGSTVVDPAPGGMGGVMVVDPAPGGMGGGETGGGGMGGGGMGGGGSGGEGGMVVDPAPGGMGGVGGMGSADGVQGEGKHKLRLIDQWFDTSPKKTLRSDDLPMFEPPAVKLMATRKGDEVNVRLLGATDGMTTRWEATGMLTGQGTEIRWRPAADRERLRVAVRSRGGVAVLSIRAKDVVA